MFKTRVKVSNIRKPEMSFKEDFWVDTDPIHKTLKPILAVIGGFLASSPTPTDTPGYSWRT